MTVAALLVAIAVAAALSPPAPRPTARRVDYLRPRVRRRRPGAGDPATAVAEAADLVAVAAGAGLNVYRALEVAAAAAPEPMRTELLRVLVGVHSGRPLREGMADLAQRLGRDDAATLARVVVAAHARGTPLAPSAGRLADDVRQAQRRAAEAAARRAPIKMLFPLAFLILPSFLLLSAAPLFVVALREVHL